MAYIGRTTDGFGVRQRFVFTPNAGTTSISGNDVSGATLTFSDSVYMDVFLNGVLLKAGTDYNTNTANTIAGLTATVANDEVTVLVYDIFTTADMVSATSGGTFTGNVNFSGNIDVDGTANLDVVDIDGAVDMASTLAVSGNVALGGTLDMNGAELILDADADTSITADTDDQIDFKIGGSDKMSLTSSALNVTGNIEPTGSVRVDDGQYFQAGNSYDLQMYHDGSNSFIEDQGTGDLRLKGSVIRLLSDNVVISNAANNEDMITAAADGAVNLRHNHVSCLTTTSDGGIDIEGGDIIFSTSGKGIVLGATSNTDANTLDDYEEGTWTPTFYLGLSSQSWNQQHGHYIKVGQKVTVTFWLYGNGSGNTSDGNGMVVQGLPFNVGTSSSSHSYSRGHGVVNYVSLGSTNGAVTLYGHNGLDRVGLGHNSGITSFTAGSNGAAANSSYVIGGFTYITGSF